MTFAELMTAQLADAGATSAASATGNPNSIANTGDEHIDDAGWRSPLDAWAIAHPLFNTPASELALWLTRPAAVTSDEPVNGSETAANIPGVETDDRIAPGIAAPVDISRPHGERDVAHGCVRSDATR